MFLLLREAHSLLVDHAARGFTRCEDTYMGVGLWCCGNHSKFIFLGSSSTLLPSYTAGSVSYHRPLLTLYCWTWKHLLKMQRMCSKKNSAYQNLTVTVYRSSKRKSWAKLAPSNPSDSMILRSVPWSYILLWHKPTILILPSATSWDPQIPVLPLFYLCFLPVMLQQGKPENSKESCGYQVKQEGPLPEWSGFPPM